MKKAVPSVVYLILSFVILFTIAGCAGDMMGTSRSQAGRGTGFDTLDLTIGVLPTSGSLNPDQNMYPGLASAMDRYQFFKSIEPVAAAPNKRFDLLLVCEPPGFAPEIKVLSGYSGKELFRKKIMALYGTLGVSTAVRELARAFAVGSPAYQEVIAEREINKRQLALPSQEVKTAVSKIVPSDIDKPVFASAEKVMGEGDMAIIIGLEQYQKLPASDYSYSDAMLVKEYFLSLGMKERNIEILTNERATYSALRKSLEAWLPNRVDKKSRVFIYYSGHGSPDPSTGEAYIVPYDGDPNYLSVTGYPLKKLYENLGKLPAEEVVIILDACFTGLGDRSVLAKGTRPLVMVADTGVLASNMAVLTATQGTQISTSSSLKGHGIFTYYFLKALKDGKRNIAEIYEYIGPRVEDEAKALNVQQRPGVSPVPAKLAGRFILRK
ncbi:MAG: caspase family protein [Syntrophales bacterium]|nr:caspase family protein [Syntrophales bacterium]